MELKNWRLINAERKIDVAATVPGDVTADLYRANFIDDPYYGLNHKKIGWILQGDFTYETRFDIDDDLLHSEEVLLEFDGIDTFADIYLNGEHLAYTENMFLKYTFSVKGLLQEKDNVVKVCMRSTAKKMEEIDDKGYFGTFNTKRLFIRKAQCHFGWDWAPDLPGYGIYGGVRIKGVSASRINDVQYKAQNDGNVTFIATLNYNIRPWIDMNGNVISNIKTGGENDVLRYLLAKEPNKALDETECSIADIKVVGARNFVNLKVENAQLWWPSGYGEQPLYAYKVQLVREGKVLSEKSGRLAFREVELVQKPTSLTTIGYQFKINDKEIFVKGSNWVPMECFTGLAKDEKYKRLIDIAKNGNMNMLRVWGGGVYEKDYFYDYCDETGMMVWQDFMFACADIPEDDAGFVENVKKELNYQIKRLRNHPSIVYWCGVNEKTGSYGLQISHGDFLTEIVFRGIVEHLDGTRPFSPQSPYSIGDIGNEIATGESHVCSFEPCLEKGVELYREILSDGVPSFVSECAIMGPCTLENLKKIFPEDKLWPMNEYWDDRLMDNPYAAVLMTFAKRQKLYAEKMYGDCKGVEDFICKGMTVHAETLRAEAEYARANKGKTWGFLNWMYSDIWPSGTWSIVDYYCEPKQVYYQLKRSYASVYATFVYGRDKKNALVIVNDGLVEKEVRYTYALKDFSGKVIWQCSGKTTVTNTDVFKEVITQSIGDEKTYLSVRYTVDGVEKTTVYSPVMWRGSQFKNEYEYTVEKKDDTLLVTVTAKTFVKGVILRLSNNCAYDYSDNYFDLEAGERKTVTIYGTGSVNPDELIVTDFKKEAES